MNRLPLLLIVASLATLGQRIQAATEQPVYRAGFVAVVNGRLILDSDIRERMASVIQGLRRQYPNNPALLEQKWRQYGQDALEDLINEELILNEAREAGREVSQEHLDQYVQGFIRTNHQGDSNLFSQSLRAQGMTVELFRERHGQSDLIAATRWEQTRNVPPPTPEQIEQYYHTHEKDFWTGESVELRMIERKRNATNSLAAMESQRKEVDEIRARLAAGADFATEARLHSQGLQASQGGDWGWLERNILRQELEGVAFSLKPGETSEVIETKEAWYLLRVVERRAAALKPLAEVREFIGKTLREVERSAVMKRWIAALRSKAFIRYYGGLAAAGDLPEKRVVTIEIKHIGVSTLSDELIRSHLRLKAGELVTQTSVDHDIRSLFGTGDFYNIRVSEVAMDTGSKLIFFVQEAPMLGDLQFAGNHTISSQELLQKLTSRIGERLDEWKLFKDSQAIQRLYQKAGYPQTTVKYVLNISEQAGRGSVRFEVTEDTK